MTDTIGWRELYMMRLRASQGGFSYTQSVTILQNMFVEAYEEAHGVLYSRINWQATVPPQYLDSKGLAAASSWLVRRIEELTYPMISAD